MTSQDLITLTIEVDTSRFRAAIFRARVLSRYADMVGKAYRRGVLTEDQAHARLMAAQRRL